MLGHASGLEAHAALGLDGWPQVDEERKDVEGEDERNHPFQNSSNVIHLSEVGNSESDGKGQFDKDKCELDPEGDAKNAVFAVLCKNGMVSYIPRRSGRNLGRHTNSKALVFPANKDGR